MSSYNPNIEESFCFDPILILGFKAYVTRYSDDTYVTQIQEINKDGRPVGNFIENFFSDDFPSDEELEEAIVDESIRLAEQDNWGPTNV